MIFQELFYLASNKTGWRFGGPTPENFSLKCWNSTFFKIDIKVVHDKIFPSVQIATNLANLRPWMQNIFGRKNIGSYM